MLPYLLLWCVGCDCGDPPLEILDGITHAHREGTTLMKKGDVRLYCALQISRQHLLFRSFVVLDYLSGGWVVTGRIGNSKDSSVVPPYKCTSFKIKYPGYVCPGECIKGLSGKNRYSY